MITQEEKRQFFATQKKPLMTMNLNGKSLKLANLPEDKKKEIMNRLAEKDEIINAGQRGILPGLKIDGIQVTKDNISQFEVSKDKVQENKIVEPIKVEEPKKKYNAQELKKLTIKQLKKMAKELGIKIKSNAKEDDIIKEILKLN